VLGCAALTAYGAVRHAAALGLGERVAVVGVGGVGSLVVQLARANGVSRVVAVDVSAEKLEAAARLGATDIVDASQGDPVEQVVALTGGGVEVAFEALGRPETFLGALGMLRDGGRMVAIGIAPAGELAPVEITRLVRRGLRIVGSYGGRPRTDMPRLLALVERGVVRPAEAVTRRYPLEDVDAAYRALDAREIVGRAIVTMPD
jgi:S-(hydroxymethyl)glutathione dehydrogenase/alcohol dehydrogenase